MDNRITTELTTPYCWVITEDAVAGYDGAEPSAVGKSGPGQAVAGDVAEALTAGRFFRLVDGKGHELAIGRLYDPSGENELAPLDDFGRQNLGALNIEFRAEGDWRLPGPAHLVESPASHSNLRRSVKWLDPAKPVDGSQLQAPGASLVAESGPHR
jgi:hypothetical protein